MAAQIIRGNAIALPLADNSVDLVVTSQPYYALRSYTDGGQHYDGQIGSEATPGEFVDALIAATREMMRVTKPSGSIWVNLGDKYAGHSNGSGGHRALARDYRAKSMRSTDGHRIPTKSLMLLPQRYAIRCVDELGLILRAEVIWSKPNATPESVSDRVRRSHEQWFHFTLSPRYYSAVDEIRERRPGGSCAARADKSMSPKQAKLAATGDHLFNLLGKMPGSVWSIPSEPLVVPADLGVDHFAAFPTEWPRRIITGWSPREVCTACGQGRRPVAEASYDREGRTTNGPQSLAQRHESPGSAVRAVRLTEITGHACACADTSAPSLPGVVLDPFGGTGTTALVADVLGRHGITVDMSADYCRLATWRTSDPGQRAKAARVAKPAVRRPSGSAGQGELFRLPARGETA